MSVAKCVAAAAGSGTVEALNGQRKWRLAIKHQQTQAMNGHMLVHLSWMVSRERTRGIHGVLKFTCREVVPKWLIETGGASVFEGQIVSLWMKLKTTWSNSSARHRNLAVTLLNRCGHWPAD